MLLSPTSRLARKRPFVLATSPLVADGIPASLDLDFVNNVGIYNGAEGDSLSRLTVTRASQAYAQDLAGNWIVFPSGFARRTNRGLLMESARTNLFLNSSTTMVGQSITVTTPTVYTLSVIGATGTVSVTAGGPAGSATAGVPYTFTTNATTVTLTVPVTPTGPFKNIQFELGSFASSPILAGGSATLRAQDVITVAPFLASGTNYSIFAYGAATANVPGGAQVIFGWSDGTANNRTIFYNNNGGLVQNIAAGGVTVLSLSSGAFLTATSQKMAMAYAQGNQASAINGVVTITATSALIPATYTVLDIGSQASAFAWDGYIQRVAAWSGTRVSNTGLQNLTQPS